MIAHCLFEQSGTFKNEFKKLGINAFDYDILNKYGETDFVIDLFEEIRNGYEGKTSIFDEIKTDDIIMAFFPCVRFENQIMLSFRGQLHGMEKWTYRQKMEHDMKLLGELKVNYDTVNQLFILCMERNLKLIMENPFSEQHFLRRYWCYPPSIIDRDRRENGDYYKKPTQFWFLNCKPKNNFVAEPLEWNSIELKDAIQCMTKEHYQEYANNIKEARSMIHPSYARRFIKMQILEQTDAINPRENT